MYPFLSKMRSWSVIMQYLTIFRQMEFSIILKPTYRMVDYIRLYFQKNIVFLSLKTNVVIESSANPDEIPHVAFDLGIHCLPKYPHAAFNLGIHYLP